VDNETYGVITSMTRAKYPAGDVISHPFFLGLFDPGYVKPVADGGVRCATHLSVTSAAEKLRQA
jgi:hypothetical protein